MKYNFDTLIFNALVLQYVLHLVSIKVECEVGRWQNVVVATIAWVCVMFHQNREQEGNLTAAHEM
jgi:hypothetical protein